MNTKITWAAALAILQIFPLFIMFDDTHLKKNFSKDSYPTRHFRLQKLFREISNF